MRIYNTQTREIEEFKPLNPPQVSFYSCGQTVYDDLHIGNAKTYAVWDLVRRNFEREGYQVTHIQNFTDVGHLTDDADEGDDKILLRAAARNLHPMQLVDTQIRDYWIDMDALQMLRPHVAPRATALVPEMIELVSTLLEKGFAYEVEGDVYYDVSKFENYGKMARLDLEGLQAGRRIATSEKKRGPLDFALWIKAPKEHLMRWTSPWSVGYPGWHLECSVMAMKFLGETIDIHAGGMDHIPVHHTNEIAQSEAATGKPFANYWMHSVFVILNGERMSKSGGNYVTARQMIDKYGGAATKFYLVSAHYRSELDYTEENFDAVVKRFSSLRNTYLDARRLSGTQAPLSGSELRDALADESESWISEAASELEGAHAAMSDDLATPRALAHINAMSNLIRKNEQRSPIMNVAASMLREAVLDLGVDLELEMNPRLDTIARSVAVLRDELRTAKHYEFADKLRDVLSDAGIQLRDTKNGPAWEY